MIHQRVNLYEEGEYTYPAAYGFQPNIRTYLHEDGKDRPCILVVPGGGYCMVVPHEGEPVAMDFYNRGMNAAVLTYTSDITMSVPLKQQPMRDAARAVRLLRKRHEEFHILPDKIILCGFSAGGHVCASLCTHFAELDAENEKEAYGGISCRPDAAMLCYPVITSGEFTHIYSMQALMGKNPTKEEQAYFSLEKQVTPDTPPCFLWQTVKDDLVPVENSYLYAQALRKNGVDFAHYAFPLGGHGMSIASKELWTAKAISDYTMEQVGYAVEAVKNGNGLQVSEERRRELMEQFFGDRKEEEAQKNPKEEEVQEDPKEEEVQKNPEEEKQEFVSPHPDVSTWPYLAEIWLRKAILSEDI